MTARRDPAEVEKRGQARRTHGGALGPSLAIQEDLFFRRVEVAVEAEERPPAAAVELLASGEAVFLGCPKRYCWELSLPVGRATSSGSSRRSP
jgi:DeoR/GlpR family transcriptional regulator of sugar metabolism